MKRIIIGGCLGIPLVFCLLPFIYAFSFCQPQGDDFDFITRSMFLFDLPGAIYEAGREWLTWSGRYSTHFLFVFFGAAPGSQIVTGLVCLCAIIPFFIGSCLIARNSCHRRPWIFGLSCLLALFISHSDLWIYYLYTDALTAGLQGSLYILFLSFLCKLVEISKKNATDKRLLIKCVFWAVLTIGIYETTAIAIFWSCIAALFLIAPSPLPKNVHNLRIFVHFPPAKPFFILLLAITIAILFSWLAPGNMQRSMARAITWNIKLTQLTLAPKAWLDAVCSFWLTPWPLASTLLGLILAFGSKPKPIRRPLFFITIILLTFLAFTASASSLLALSDTPLNGNLKQIGCIQVYTAIAWSAITFCIFRQVHNLKARKAIYVFGVTALFIYSIFTPNFQNTAINAASGEMLALNDFMDERKKALKKLADLVPINLRWPSFGLKGELETKSASRKPNIQNNLPQVTLDQWNGSTFPIYKKEAHPANALEWPNLWAAWSYGIGGIRALPPPPDTAINMVLAGEGVELFPSSLFSQAWLVNAPGNLGVVLSWLVVKPLKPLEKIWLLRPNPVNPRRLAPIFCQKAWLEHMLDKALTPLTLQMRLSGSLMLFSKPEIFEINSFYAFPLGITQAYLFPIFISQDGHTYSRLQPYL